MVILLLMRRIVVKRIEALLAAAEHGNLGVVELLLEHGERTRDLDLEELEELEEIESYDDRKLDHQGIALYKAAVEGHSEIVDILLKTGADPGFRDRKGHSIADVAEKGHEETTRRQSLAESRSLWGCDLCMPIK